MQLNHVVPFLEYVFLFSRKIVCHFGFKDHARITASILLCLGIDLPGFLF